MHLWQFRPVLHNILAAKADSLQQLDNLDKSTLFLLENSRELKRNAVQASEIR